jgi:hypothetical protein
MDAEIRELAEILSREQEVYQKYLELLTEQQRYLMNNDVNSVKATTDLINHLAQEAADLESGRARVMNRLQRLGALKPGQDTLARIMEKFKGPQFDELEKLKETLLDVHSKIKEQSTRNELLIANSMQMIANTMQYIHEINNPQVTYNNPSNAKRDSLHQKTLISRTI